MQMGMENPRNEYCKYEGGDGGKKLNRDGDGNDIPQFHPLPSLIQGTKSKLTHIFIAKHYYTLGGQGGLVYFYFLCVLFLQVPTCIVGA